MYILGLASFNSDSVDTKLSNIILFTENDVTQYYTHCSRSSLSTLKSSVWWPIAIKSVFLVNYFSKYSFPDNNFLLIFLNITLFKIRNFRRLL